jgi:hypothetical protein
MNYLSVYISDVIVISAENMRRLEQIATLPEGQMGSDLRYCNSHRASIDSYPFIASAIASFENRPVGGDRRHPSDLRPARRCCGGGPGFVMKGASRTALSLLY